MIKRSLMVVFRPTVSAHFLRAEKEPLYRFRSQYTLLRDSAKAGTNPVVIKKTILFVRFFFWHIHGNFSLGGLFCYRWLFPTLHKLRVSQLDGHGFAKLISWTLMSLSCERKPEAIRNILMHAVMHGKQTDAYWYLRTKKNTICCSLLLITKVI